MEISELGSWENMDIVIISPNTSPIPPTVRLLLFTLILKIIITRHLNFIIKIFIIRANSFKLGIYVSEEISSLTTRKAGSLLRYF